MSVVRKRDVFSVGVTNISSWLRLIDCPPTKGRLLKRRSRLAATCSKAIGNENEKPCRVEALRCHPGPRSLHSFFLFRRTTQATLLQILTVATLLHSLLATSRHLVF